MENYNTCATRHPRNSTGGPDLKGYRIPRANTMRKKLLQSSCKFAGPQRVLEDRDYVMRLTCPYSFLDPGPPVPLEDLDFSYAFQ